MKIGKNAVVIFDYLVFKCVLDERRKKNAM